ncbi:uncharacterized protein LOC105191435 [Harpegnathos saltator]|uniref:uncharacterized protein LOC105191435 n=1 Tax=Harpegnathos saltator TaxID=610380 RepID=UPI000591601C|nr:uncharacterized protein LOC105191435 [Harpegnathos saltator]
MGITMSKIKIGPWGKEAKGGSKVVDTPGSKMDNYEDMELMLLRKSIKRNPEIFILNNLMLCVQFFENYEENIIQVKKTLASSSEAKLNKKLPPQKHVLMPDVLQEHVSHNVAFISTRQTSRPTIEPLHPIRIYVVHDNIEITEQHYLPEYSSVNNEITYNMMVKPSEYQGYVRLELLDETPYTKNSVKKEDIDPSAEDDDETYSDTDSIYVPKPASKMVRSQKMKKGNFQPNNARSLPNLHNDEAMYKDQAYHSRDNLYETRSSHDIRPESDYEHVSSASDDRLTKRAWPKSELPAKSGNHQRQVCSGATKLKKMNSRSPAGSTSSGYRSGHYAVDSDSDSSYHVMQSSSVQLSCNTNRDAASSCNSQHSYSDKPIADASTEVYSILNSKIPQRCFKKIMHTRDGKIYDPREEKKLLQNNKQRRLRMAIRRRNYEVSYISSLEFMRHFVNLYKDQLGQLFGFDQEDLDEVKPEGSVIYCDKIMISHNSRLCKVESYEVTPAIWLQWPEYSQEWLDRPRSTWPTYSDISKVKDFGCHMVPEGFLPKKGSNLYHELEWQLMFPAAERYLETCMTHSQVQVYLIALMLHKSFIRPVFDTMYGLTTSHIRNKMFWLIEEDDRPSKWPDNRTGECLIKLLNGLYRCLSQNEPTLSDYFVRDKNVFQRVPSDHLLHTQKQLKRIIENPVMYLFHAMENIRHSEKFFPRLNYEMLLKILTMDALALVNPALGQSMFMSSASSSRSKAHDESHMARDEIYNKPGGFWDTAKLQTEKKIYTRVVTNRTLINPRRATDSIIEISVRCGELEGPRLGALLDFFVRHFIKMAERCHQYQAYQQKKVYLDQADRLSIILSEVSRYTDDAKAYRDKIYILKLKKTSSRSQQKDLPETPKRNGEPLFVGTLKDRFIREAADVTVEPKEKQPQSSREDCKDKVAKSTFYEVRFENKDNTQVKPAKPAKSSEGKSSEITSILKNPTPRDQCDESASSTAQKVVSLADNQNDSFLTETTYI